MKKQSYLLTALDCILGALPEKESEIIQYKSLMLGQNDSSFFDGFYDIIQNLIRTSSSNRQQLLANSLARRLESIKSAELLEDDCDPDLLLKSI